MQAFWNMSLAWFNEFDIARASWSLLKIVLWILFGLGPQFLIGWAVFALFSLSMRRRERAALFLDLIESGLKEGMAPEQTIVRTSASRDRALGVRFHLVAAHLEKGCSLPEALERVPRLLPPQVAATLKAGLPELGFERVLPACRAVLKDGLSQNHSALNWQSLFFFFLSPVQLAGLFVITVYVLPKFDMILSDMVSDNAAVGSTWFLAFLSNYSWVLVTVMMNFYVVLLGGFLAITGGPRVAGWFKRIFGAAWDQCVLAIPWRRKRLERDFISMLALLLDANLPEERAVTLAAAATANRALMAGADHVIVALRDGVALPQALRKLHRLPELQWRLVNALQGGGRVQEAVAGWCQSLDARAFQQEQAAAHLTTTGLVLANGLVVGVIVLGVFSVLIAIINQGVLW